MVTVQRVETLGYRVFYSIFTVEPEENDFSNTDVCLREPFEAVLLL